MNRELSKCLVLVYQTSEDNFFDVVLTEKHYDVFFSEFELKDIFYLFRERERRKRPLKGQKPIPMNAGLVARSNNGNFSNI